MANELINNNKFVTKDGIQHYDTLLKRWLPFDTDENRNIIQHKENEFKYRRLISNEDITSLDNGDYELTITKRPNENLQGLYDYLNTTLNDDLRYITFDTTDIAGDQEVLSAMAKINSISFDSDGNIVAIVTTVPVDGYKIEIYRYCLVHIPDELQQFTTETRSIYTGEYNTILGTDHAGIIGSYNCLIGKESEEVTGDYNLLVGTSHKVTNSNYTTLLGKDLGVLNTEGSLISGYKNTISNSKRNFIIGNNNEITNENEAFINANIYHDNIIVGQENSIKHAARSGIIGHNNNILPSRNTGEAVSSANTIIIGANNKILGCNNSLIVGYNHAMSDLNGVFVAGTPNLCLKFGPEVYQPGHNSLLINTSHLSSTSVGDVFLVDTWGGAGRGFDIKVGRYDRSQINSKPVLQIRSSGEGGYFDSYVSFDCNRYEIKSTEFEIENYLSCKNDTIIFSKQIQQQQPPKYISKRGQWSTDGVYNFFTTGVYELYLSFQFTGDKEPYYGRTSFSILNSIQWDGDSTTVYSTITMAKQTELFNNSIAYKIYPVKISFSRTGSSYAIGITMTQLTDNKQVLENSPYWEIVKIR